jgi:hypothetical protein
MNLSQSPNSDCRLESETELGHEPRWRFLVFASLLLAIAIEVFPTELDLLSVAFLSKNLRLAILGKSVCLTIILLPLIVYIGLNGWHGLRAVRQRVFWIMLIVLINLVLYGIMLSRYLYICSRNIP